MVVRPFFGDAAAIDEEMLAVLAADRAARHGWKNIVVAPDPIYGDSAHTMNWSQYGKSWETGCFGDYLIDAEAIAQGWD